MDELKQKMRQMFGKGNIQLELFLPTPAQPKALPASPEGAMLETETAEAVKTPE